MTNEKSEQVFVFNPLSLEVDFVIVSDVINFPLRRIRQKFSIFKISQKIIIVLSISIKKTRKSLKI